MDMDEGRAVELAGSERTALPGASRVGEADGTEQIEVTVMVRRTGRSDAGAAVASLAATAPHEREHLDAEAFAQQFGADPADLEKVAAFAAENGLAVSEQDVARRRVVLRGTVESMGRAFGVGLGRYQVADSQMTYRGREGAISIPAQLDGVVEAVLGLDDRPQASPRRRAGSLVPAQQAHAFAVPSIGQLYDWPGGSAEGQCIAIVELGGGFRTADLDAFFTGIGQPTPTVEAVIVDGAGNHPGVPSANDDGEVMLDIEVAAALAPGAKIAVYFAPNTARGFTDAVTAATHDTQHNPSVISISWGMREAGWTAQAMKAMDQAFADAALLGVTVTVAAGDNGARDGGTDGRAHVDFPASSPHVLACGGTRLAGSGSTISSETVWNDGSGGATGGGVSDVFDLPAWQAHAGVPASVNPGGRVGRGVPDVAGDADPATGYLVRVDGSTESIGGTSAVAPLWAGLVALLNARTGRRLGFLNADLYAWAASSSPFRDITVGDNAAPGAPGYSAGTGWDACTGLGTPRGNALLGLVTPATPA